MDLNKLLQLLTILLANGVSEVLSYNISPLTNIKDKWPQHDLHQTLISIDERLRVVDSVRYGINRLEISIDRINNKLDSMESRISSLQTQVDSLESRGRGLQSVMQMKVDSISQIIASTEMKFEMMPEQIARKVGVNQDRILLKINSIENNMEALFSKLQGSQNDALTALKTELGTKTTQLANAIDDVKQKTILTDHVINNSSKEQLQHLLNIESKVAKNEQVEMLTSRLDGIHNQLNQTDVFWAQNDSPKINEQHSMVNSLKSEFHNEVQKFVNKFGNIYNEASKRLHAIENAMRDHMMETNVTQKELRDKMRQLIRNQKDCEGLKRTVFDIRTEDMKSYMRMSFASLYDKLEGSGRKITNLQSELIESCSTSQGLKELEHRMLTILDKMQDTLHNKSTKMEKQTNDLLTLLKSHSSQSARAERMVVNLTHEMDQNKKNWHNALSELFGQGDSSLIIIQEIRRDLERVLKRDLPVNKRTDQTILMNNSTKNENPDGSLNRIHSVEVNHGGVLKLMTETGNTDHVKKTTIKPTTIEASKSNVTTILALGQSINATDEELDTILEWRPSTTKEDEEGMDSKDSSIKIPNTLATDKGLPDEFVSHIMLDYIKLMREQITLKEFLKEANIARTYSSLPEMIEHLRDMDSVPDDFIDELLQYEADNKDFDFDELKKPWIEEDSNPEDDHYDQYET